MRNRIYLDHHATTPLDPRALEAMLPFLRDRFGNASSATHSFGWEAREAVEQARCEVAALVGARPEEVVFTGGATESDTLALLGAVDRARRAGVSPPHVIVAETEHAAVLDPVRRLERDGVPVTRIGVDRFGRIDPDDVRRALRPQTVIVSIMAANNEIGTIQPLAEVAAILAGAGVAFHSDAAQAAGRVALDLRGAGPGLLSLSAHKMHGPKGVGALVVRSGLEARLEARTFGGGHERGLRPGTPDVPAIVGFGAAAAIALEAGGGEGRRLAALRDRLLDAVRGGLGGVEVNGHPTERLPNNLHLSLDGVDGESLATALGDEVALSTGSACASAGGGESHVLKALGLPPERARESIRIGLGRFNTEEEIDLAGARIVEEARRLRTLDSWGRGGEGKR